MTATFTPSVFGELRCVLAPPAALMLGLFALAPAAGAQALSSAAQEAFAKAPNADLGDRFGFAMAVSGNTLVVGAPREDSGATGVDGNGADNSAADSGAAYVYVRDGGSWSLQAYLKASNTDAGDRFGYSVAISGDTIVVGSIAEESAASGVNGNQEDDSLSSAGAAYVFVRNGTTWSQQAYLKASNPGAPDRFGFAVAASGDTVVVTADLESSAAIGVNGEQADDSAPNAGAGYVFVRNGTTWSQQAYLKAFNTLSFMEFGTAVALSGDTVVVGSWIEASAATGVNGDMSDLSAGSAGAAYVFVRSGSTWSTDAYIKASNTDAGDEFGSALALDGDTLAVGAWGEDSGADGVGGDQGDNSASRTGAVYVFTRTAGTWSQQAYVKASNPDPSDQFSRALSLGGGALGGGVLAVGAWGEASSATGVDGDASDNSSFGAGAAYLFARNGVIWGQLGYLKASNTGPGDVFGSAVACSGNTLAAGAWSEDSNGLGLGGAQGNDLSADSGAAYLFDITLLPWTDLGSGLAGLHGEPVLTGHGTLEAGDLMTLRLTAARESATTYLVAGAAAVNLPFSGGTLVPAFEAPLGLYLTLATDIDGDLLVSSPWPTGVPSAFTMYFQCWVADAVGPAGLAASNAVAGTTP